MEKGTARELAFALTEITSTLQKTIELTQGDTVQLPEQLRVALLELTHGIAALELEQPEGL